MISNLNGSGSVRVHLKKAVFTGLGSVRLPGSNALSNRHYVSHHTLKDTCKFVLSIKLISNTIIGNIKLRLA